MSVEFRRNKVLLFTILDLKMLRAYVCLKQIWGLDGEKSVLSPISGGTSQFEVEKSASPPSPPTPTCRYETSAQIF